MTNRNINLQDTENEIIRYAINMLPTNLLSHISPEAKRFMKGFKHLPKKQIKLKIKLADTFNNLITTQNTKSFSFTDFNLIEGELTIEPYQILLRSLGAECFTKLYEHAKLVDSCINKPFNETLVIEMKDYLEIEFNYFNEDITFSMSVDEFYNCLILSFIAHLDACIHFFCHSELIKPISFGWLFMHKLNPDTWIYNCEESKYILKNKSRTSLTKPSRSFIELLQTIGYWHKKKEMPKSTYNIDEKINWEVDDPDGKLTDFIKRKKEGKWVSLENMYWLLGFSNDPKNESNKTLENWQKSFIHYTKTENIEKLGGLSPSTEGMIWFVYAFFQLIYIEANKKNKLSKKQSCIFYPEYYDLWKCFTNYYESYIEKSVKDERVEWSAYLKKQATPIECMT